MSRLVVQARLRGLAETLVDEIGSFNAIDESLLTAARAVVAARLAREPLGALGGPSLSDHLSLHFTRHHETWFPVLRGRTALGAGLLGAYQARRPRIDLEYEDLCRTHAPVPTDALIEFEYAGLAGTLGFGGFASPAHAYYAVTEGDEACDCVRVARLRRRARGLPWAPCGYEVRAVRLDLVPHRALLGRPGPVERVASV